ncbi:hypothetical protein LXA43DRAFT_1068778 [Ganoderma leucocontextum]|nr:hypothetical protein LXA43DRAFT_1068778 [Ganoderma leucocontextum]
MPWRTFFVCEDVKFYASELPGSPSDDSGCTNWPVKILVLDLGVETPWLMVEKCAPNVPIVFRALRKGWKISSDEDDLTITMRPEGEETLTMSDQTLCFEKETDFWLLMYHIMLSRNLRPQYHHPVLERYTGRPASEVKVYGHMPMLQNTVRKSSVAAYLIHAAL